MGMFQTMGTTEHAFGRHWVSRLTKAPGVEAAGWVVAPYLRTRMFQRGSLFWSVSRPVAVSVSGRERTYRIRIVDLTRLIQMAIALFTAAAAGWLCVSRRFE
jgi:hypothetical protein